MSDILVGLDLGQMTDPTAACVLRRSLAIDADGLPVRDHRGVRQYRFDALAMKRYELGTLYKYIVADMVDKLRSPMCRPKCTLICDATGVGRPVVEMFRSALKSEEFEHVRLWAITITGGHEEPRKLTGPNEINVPKVLIVSALKAAVGHGRITVPPSLPFADVLRHEMAAFQVKVTKSANEVYAAREGDHDDLVLSLSLPIYLSTKAFFEMEVPDAKAFIKAHPLTRSWATKGDLLPGEQDILLNMIRKDMDPETLAVEREEEIGGPEVLQRAERDRLAAEDPWNEEFWEDCA